jgi:hypothetical protein
MNPKGRAMESDKRRYHSITEPRSGSDRVARGQDSRLRFTTLASPIYIPGGLGNNDR